MTLTERKAYWKKNPEKQKIFIAKIIELIKNFKPKQEIIEHNKISYAMTDREKRARGGWGNWTSH